MENFIDILHRDKDVSSFAVCVVVDTKGSSPAKTGAKMIVNSDGSITGTIGGGDLEKKVITNALEALANRKPGLYRHDLLHQHSMCCGGTVNIYIEPQMEKMKLYIFGAGHTGQALSSLATDLGFDIYVIDARKEYIDQICGDKINKMNLHHQVAIQALKFDGNTFICIMTHDHAIDRDILGYCIGKPHRYLGMIGSHRKVEVTRKMFQDAKIASEDQLNRIDMPMGVPIHAQGPKEIALSILAKLIEVKNTVVHE